MHNETYDVVIVGAGIAGATIAKIIAESGNKRILILEAGRNTGMSADKYQSHVLAFQQALAKVPNSPYADNPNAPQPSVLSLRQIKPGVPETNGYFVQKGPLPFSSNYTRALGGTTLHWLGTCLRMLPNDFNLQSKYGRGVDWPIEYSDLKPYYERAERDIIGVAGNVADQTYPGIDKNYFGDYEFPMERIPPSYVDTHLARSLHNKTVRLNDKKYQLSIDSTPAGRNSTPRKGYQAIGAVGNPAQGLRCEGNSSCIPICPVQAKYSALKTLSQILRDHPSRKKPNKQRSSVEIISQAVVTRVDIGENGKVSGIRYKLYDKESSTDAKKHVVRAKVYVLAAAAIENAKLLLASDAANSSKQVGCNLMDHPLILTWGLLEEKVWSYRGPGSTSGIPTFRDGDFRKDHSAFRVEIGNWGWNFAAGAPYSTFEIMTGKKGMFGKNLRHNLSEVIPRQFRIAWEMEQIPQMSNRISIDPAYKDQFGEYRPVVDYNLPDYVWAGVAAAKKVADQSFKKLGLKPLGKKEDPDDFMFPRDYTHYDPGAAGFHTFKGKGYAFEGSGHLAGTHRMGKDPKTSVVDCEQRTHDHKNLFLVGCGNMPTVGTSNPTLTMTALAIWAGENVIKQLHK